MIVSIKYQGLSTRQHLVLISTKNLTASVGTSVLQHLSTSVHVQIKHITLELGEGLLDSEGSESHAGVPVPALGHQLGQAPEQLSTVPPSWQIWPGACCTHHLETKYHYKYGIKSRFLFVSLKVLSTILVYKNCT